MKKKLIVFIVGIALLSCEKERDTTDTVEKIDTTKDIVVAKTIVGKWYEYKLEINVFNSKGVIIHTEVDTAISQEPLEFLANGIGYIYSSNIIDTDTMRYILDTLKTPNTLKLMDVRHHIIKDVFIDTTYVSEVIKFTASELVLSNTYNGQYDKYTESVKYTKIGYFTKK